MDLETLCQQLQAAEEHVARGERLITRQCEIVQQLSSDGLDARDAEAVLTTLEASQELNISDRDRLRLELARKTTRHQADGS